MNEHNDIPLQPYDYVALVKERDALRAENERFREALKYIVDRGYTGASDVAQQALKGGD